jgi:hypothetical protein
MKQVLKYKPFGEVSSQFANRDLTSLLLARRRAWPGLALVASVFAKRYRATLRQPAPENR